MTSFSISLHSFRFTFYLSAFRLYLFQVRIRRVTARWASAPGLGGLGWSVRWMATWGLLPQAPIGRPLPSTAAEFLLGTSFLGDTKMVWLGKTWLSFLGGSPTTHSTAPTVSLTPNYLLLVLWTLAGLCQAENLINVLVFLVW